VLSEISEHSVTKWQGEWDQTTKCAITKSFFPKIEDSLKLKINITSNFTTKVTGHGNIKSYLHKYGILDSPICFCKNGEQTAGHILFECKLLEQERDSLKAAVLRSENWPVNKKTNSLQNSIKPLKNSLTIYRSINYKQQ
jgi:hypothetical protein